MKLLGSFTAGAGGAIVAETKQGIVPIQVSWEAPSEQHHAALEAFYEQFPHAGEAL